MEGRPILASEDIRQIFGEISNLYQVHTAIHDDLKVLIDNWTEDCCIAEIVNKYSERLLKVSECNKICVRFYHLIKNIE